MFHFPTCGFLYQQTVLERFRKSQISFLIGSDPQLEYQSGVFQQLSSQDCSSPLNLSHKVRDYVITTVLLYQGFEEVEYVNLVEL